MLSLALLLFASLPSTCSAVLEGFDPSGTGSGYPEAASGRSGPKPSLSAHRIVEGPIELDGRLDEADWIAAEAGTGFTQFQPNRHGEPCEETVIKFVYDDDAFYVGVACYHLNGSELTTCLSRRDNIANSDRIRVYIDPYHDLMSGYHFRINPDGVKEDYYNYGDLYHDISWDAVWEAETSIDEQGWYAEMRIPFSSVRYREVDSMTWGFNVFRYTDSQGQRTGWSNWDRDQGGFMSRSGTVTGISGIGAPGQLEILPYFLASTTDPADPYASGADEDREHFGNFGADIKYGVTADLTLNATIQPDFGQVEADPSELNLSPFETYYDEKRPFFVEGAQFFYHPDNTVFYSRRIGTGSQNSRIRFAGKLTGKVAGDVSTAVMVAATDETEDGQVHNLFKSGDQQAVYAIGRFGKEFNDGNYSFNVMQTGVFRDESTWDGPTRNGYVSGADFKLQFKDRMYEVTGSFVGSTVDGKPYEDGDSTADPSPTYGTGSRFELEKAAGDWTWALTTRHQTDKLDLNDIGYINNPDHYAVQGWVQRDFNSDNDESFFTRGNVSARYYQSWIYADREFEDPENPGEVLWSYESGHDQLKSLNIDGYLETRTCWGFWAGTDLSPQTTDIYATRQDPVTGERGPLFRSPANLDVWAGFATDYRKDLAADVSLNLNSNAEGNRGYGASVGFGWAQNSRMNHNLSLGYRDWHADDQWVGNFANPGEGIGGTSYVFAELDQQTWDMTLRSSVLFSRDQSLELYLQPYLTVGSYSNPRELMTPDSYDLQPYDGYDVSGDDFSYGAVNLNMVYRWEYRPGSTLFLVWSHTRSDFDARSFHDEPGQFTNDFSTDPLLNNEGENRFMAKINYWFPI
jgi:hypothetical protein